MSVVNNVFTPTISGVADVSGNFYDFKSRVDFNVTMEVDPLYTLDSFVIDIDEADHTTSSHVRRTLTNIPRIVNGYTLATTSIYKSVSDTGYGDIGFNFVNHGEYKILYKAIFRLASSNPVSATLVTTSHIQIFTYYSTPVTLDDDFLVSDNVSNGDDINITGLVLDLSGNEIDTTTPVYLTFSFQEMDDEVGDNNNPEELDAPYIVRLPYASSGSYTLLDNTLSNGSTYSMDVTALWDLGYNTSITSAQVITVINRPHIAEDGIEVLPLYLRDITDDVITINLSPVPSGEAVPNKLWFQFKTTDGYDTLVATAGGVDGVDNNSGTNSYSFTLSELVIDTSGVYLENDVTYNVVVKARYDDISPTPIYGYSDPSPVTFDLTEPTISDIAINYLCIRDPSANIATITVNHEAYELYAPYATDGIKFVFYDGATEVARTIAYPFANQSGSGSELYDIKLSEVISTSGYLENDITYTVKAAVKVTDHSETTEYVISSESYNVTFDLTEPTISNIAVNSLYLVDPSANIATITVDHEAYELYAPYTTDGIKFVFYDGATEVARTIAYDFVNSSAGYTDYDIKLSEVISTSGYLTHGITYTVKAAVKVTDHSGTTDYVISSEFYNITFDLTEPTISDIAVNSLYLVDPSANIATITVDHEAYELYAPYATDGIKFVFYDGATEVARTIAYPFANQSGSGSELYDIKLSEVISTSGYLENDITYTVKAAVKVTDHSETTEYVISSESYNVTFDLVRPVISITPYDVQNDGGQDGVFDPDSTDVDSASQIVATVSMDNMAYELYAPNATDGILFIFYDASGVEVARTSEYPFDNFSSGSPNLYNIRLDEITASTLLTNGTLYKVKAQVTLVDHSGTEELRLSDAFTDVTFTQGIAPLPYVEIINTWELILEEEDPETNRANFLASDDIGISGYFSKTAQFGSLYYKHLDLTSTKFKLEYKVYDASDNIVTDWTTVKKAKLVLQDLSNNELLADAIDRARSTAGVLSTVSSGEYANIPGTGLGTDQGEIVFYIPQQQTTGVAAFDETDIVEVRVTVIDRYSPPSLWGGDTESDPTVSEHLHVILKIDEYDFTTGADSEPWNSVDGSDLRINIPVTWNSEYSHSVKVSHKYSTGASYGAAVEFLKSSYPSTVSFVVDPAQGTTLYYKVVYVVENPNLGSGAEPYETTDGILTEKNVPNKFFPESSDYAILNASYATFNTDEESSISFDLSFNIDPENRLDGVNVYFASTDSSIDKVRIGSYTTAGSKTITLIDVTDVSGVHLEIMDPSGNIVTSAFSWDKYDSANISFEAFRDARVNSTDAFYDPLSSASDPVESDFYVESGSDADFGTTDENPIWNVPELTAPSDDGSITLSGGVINMVDSSNNHFIHWTMTSVDEDRDFTYDVKMTNNTTSEEIHNTLNYTDPSGNYILAIDIDSVSDVAKYTVELTKVFNGTTANRETSPVDTIVFHTIYVDTSNMDITVESVSNTQYVNLSWDEPDISGNSVTASGQELSSFENNIYAHYIKYTDSSFNELTRLDSDPENLIEQIVSPATKQQYTLPVQAIGTLYEFFMYVEAQVKYTVNGDVSVTKSEPFEVPTTLTTAVSQYRVSSVPSVGVLPDSDVNIVPVLIQGSSNPTLLLNLNANGLEDEGFISVVVILTQDGTDDKPEGEQVILVFPDTGSTFSFAHSVVGGGAGIDPRLGGGDSSTSVPRNLDYSVLSTDPSDNNYTLTVGTVDSDGRYGLSTLEMPPTSESGFVSGTIVNYMVMLTTRRGTDIGVGEFTYEAIPSVQNVTITTGVVDGVTVYTVNFDITPA